MPDNQWLLTDETINAVESAITLGAPKQYAAISAGISESSFYAYIRIAKAVIEEDRSPANDNENQCLKLLQAVKRAKSRFVQNNLKIIQKAAIDGSWQAGAWLLERREPDHFSKTEKLEHTGKVALQKSEDEVDKEIEEIEKRLQVTDVRALESKTSEAGVIEGEIIQPLPERSS